MEKNGRESLRVLSAGTASLESPTTPSRAAMANLPFARTINWGMQRLRWEVVVKEYTKKGAFAQMEMRAKFY